LTERTIETQDSRASLQPVVIKLIEREKQKIAFQILSNFHNLLKDSFLNWKEHATMP